MDQVDSKIKDIRGGEGVSMSVKEMSLFFSGGVPIQYFGLDPIDPRSSLFFSIRYQPAMKTIVQVLGTFMP